jgi:hypothetical protein
MFSDGRTSFLKKHKNKILAGAALVAAAGLGSLSYVNREAIAKAFRGGHGTNPGGSAEESHKGSGGTRPGTSSFRQHPDGNGADHILHLLGNVKGFGTKEASESFMTFYEQAERAIPRIASVSDLMKIDAGLTEAANIIKRNIEAEKDKPPTRRDNAMMSQFSRMQGALAYLIDETRMVVAALYKAGASSETKPTR